MDFQACRICLNNSNDFLSLDALYEKRTVAEMVFYCSGVEITMNDDILPQKLCHDCMDKIFIACEIKQKCIETDIALREHCEEKTKMEGFERIEWALNDVDMKTEVLEHECSVVYADNLKCEHEPIDTSTRPEEEDDEKHNKRRRKSIKRKRHQSTPSTPQNENYKCFLCEEVFDLIHSKDLHVKFVHSKERNCPLCNYKSQTALALENHIKGHYVNLYIHFCEYCAAKFKHNSRLRDHIQKNHLNTISYSCDLCTFVSKQKNNVRRHMLTVHLKLKRFCCSDCKPNREFTTKTSLEHHQIRDHKMMAKFLCSDCGQGFATMSFLKAHKQRLGCRPGKSRNRQMTNNEMETLEDGRIQCKICSDLFDTKNKWHMHYFGKHKHSNQCDICGQQMANYSSLQRHKLVQHDKVRAFKCQFEGCGKLFSQKHSLQSHENTHTGSKPFACLHCPFKASDRSSVSKHQKKLHSQTTLLLKR